MNTTNSSPAPADGFSIGFREFITLMATMVSITALAIDAVLPILSEAGRDLAITDANQTQYILVSLLLGLTLGQLIYGPLADSYGRKRSVYIGLLVFIAGSIISLTATSFSWMLIGRFLQGIGCAAPRISSVAIVRDRFTGREMARVLSFVMAVFIFIPVVAPALGELVMVLSHWRMVFALFIGMALVIALWMFLRLPETLKPEDKHPFSLAEIGKNLKIVVSNRQTLGHSISAGLVFGCLMGYLSCARQIFQDYYDTGHMFVLYFAFSALSVGVASLVNSHFVRQLGMHKISRMALTGFILISLLFLPLILMYPDTTPFWAFLAFAICAFFCLGLLFGNLNAMAMEPMGHLAGVASSVIGALTSAVSTLLGGLIGQAYNSTLIPLVTGFLLLGICAFAIEWYLAKK